MKLLSCYTPSHKVFLDAFNTIHDVDEDVQVILKELPQECPSGEFAEDGWKLTTAKKFEFILEELTKCEPEELLAFSDIDIQYFKPISNLVEKALKDNDIVFQNDYYGHACTGFFFMRNCDAVRKLLFQAMMIIPEWRDDQEATNKLLPNGDVRYGLLPPQFFTFGMFYNHWQGQENFPLPEGIIMHHANWVKGIEKKEKLLTIVRRIYDNQRSTKSETA